MKNPANSALELSCGQKALWYLNQLEPESTAYHLALCLRLTGSIDEAALVSAWNDVGAAHPQLRARFLLRHGRPTVAVDPCFARLGVQTGGAGDLDLFWKRVAGRPFILGTEGPVRGL